MSKTCLNCKNIIPSKIIINEKERKIYSCRKYCFDCSPFDSHNNKSKTYLACSKCGEHNAKGRKLCYKCIYKEKWEKRSKLIYGIVGTACWYCNYDKGMAAISVLDFHHIDPSKKELKINAREGLYQWNKVLNEMQKCALLCVRCHREFHINLISKEEIYKIYLDKWKEIKQLKKIEAEEKIRKYCSLPTTDKSKITKINRDYLSCVECGKKNPQNSKICQSCAALHHIKKTNNKIYEIVGTACWYCNYDKGMAATPVLEFHHMDPSKKEFGITKKWGAAYSWNKVWLEMQKCVLLCARCHREVHTKLISEFEINNIYSKKWKEITKLIEAER